jgi:isoquinoline 1-oxidoreductase subunit beta
MPVNPRTIEAQVQGGAVFGMSSMLPGFAITLKDGKVQQSNFTNYTPPYMADAPIIDVHIVPSTDPPTGIGEPPATAISPAIANAVAALTGQRIRKLPIENVSPRQRNA